LAACQQQQKTPVVTCSTHFSLSNLKFAQQQWKTAKRPWLVGEKFASQWKPPFEQTANEKRSLCKRPMSAEFDSETKMAALGEKHSCEFGFGV